EQLDPDLPVRFARAAKALIGNAYDTLPVRSGDRDALLIAGHLYTEEDIVELERTVSALGEKGLIEDLHDIQTMFDELPPDATDADIDRVIDAAMEMLDPVIDCFDPANWDSELNPQAELYIDELIRAGLNEAQARAQTQLEETLEARILAKRGAASISSSQDA
ncbi:MAG: MerR family transcriptional regulator, partial [Eggerthella lenta]